MRGRRRVDGKPARVSDREVANQKRREDFSSRRWFLLGAELFVALLRLEVSLNVLTISRRHSDPIAFVGSFWCLPILDELVASSVIP